MPRQVAVRRAVTYQDDLAERLTPPPRPSFFRVIVEGIFTAPLLWVAVAILVGAWPDIGGWALIIAAFPGALGIYGILAIAAHIQYIRWWHAGGKALRDRMLHEYRAGYYCQNCDRVFIP